ncbi:MAG: SIS domain-containing protein [Sulfuricaulis sp.]|nr:SIS domain-containing protein [Sulfuricaulis sp.]
MTHTETYLAETVQIARELDYSAIEVLADQLVRLRDRGGRLFIVGLGGSAANASHAANDFKKLCSIEAYCLSDNVAELTAWANDEGWPYIFERALDAAKASTKDALLVLSVGGGTDTVSAPIQFCVSWVKRKSIPVMGIVGRDGGYTKKHATACVVVPTVEPSRVTPHTEGWQSVILHALVSHPNLQVNRTKW